MVTLFTILLSRFLPSICTSLVQYDENAAWSMDEMSIAKRGARWYNNIVSQSALFGAVFNEEREHL